MSDKHTPGPWMLTESDRFDKEMVITTQHRLDESIGCICEMDVYFTGQIGIEQEANARLIAAAPDLLEAAQRFVEVMDESFDHPDTASEIDKLNKVADAARAAIAKATGGAA